jgi:hypothetical protein
MKTTSGGRRASSPKVRRADDNPRQPYQNPSGFGVKNLSARPGRTEVCLGKKKRIAHAHVTIRASVKERK